MSLKHAISASAAFVLTVAAATDAFAQYRNDRSVFDHRQRQVRPSQHVRPAAPSAQATRTAPGAQQGKPAPRAQAVKPAPSVQPEQAPAVAAAPKPVQPKPAPMPPLTDEQMAAKSAVDELLAREPALLAARELPDPRLTRAAAAKHDIEERKAALLRARHEVDEAKRRELTERKAREDARVAALKAKPESQAKPTKSKSEPVSPKPEVNRASSGAANVAPVRQVVRMPAP